MQAGQIDFREAGVGSGRQQADIVRDADDLQCNAAQSGAHLGHAGIRLHGPAHVGGGNELLAGDAGEIRNCFDAVVGVSVDAGADGTASKAEFAERIAGPLKKLFALLDGQTVGGELLAEADGDGILHVGAARLHDAIEIFGFSGESSRKCVKDGIEGFEIQQRGEAHAGWKDVIGRLAIVDVVVRMNVGVIAKICSQDLVRAIGDHLVRVHVEADASACLEDIDDELRVPFAVDDLLCRLNNGVGTPIVDQAELAVRLGGGAFHHPQGANELSMGTQTRDGIVFNGAGGLRSIVGARGDFNKSQ